MTDQQHAWTDWRIEPEDETRRDQDVPMFQRVCTNCYLAQTVRLVAYRVASPAGPCDDTLHVPEPK